MTDGTAKKNIRLKWIAMCLVMDYVNGEVLIVLTKSLVLCMNSIYQVELYINGAKSPQKNKKPIERPEDHAGLEIFYERKNTCC